MPHASGWGGWQLGKYSFIIRFDSTARLFLAALTYNVSLRIQQLAVIFRGSRLKHFHTCILIIDFSG
jgi:hypothetical protein